MFIEKTKSYSQFDLSELKEHLKIFSGDTSYDNELSRLIQSATLFTEKQIGGDIVMTENTLTDYCVSGQYYKIDEPNIHVSSIETNTELFNYTVYKFNSYTLIKFLNSINTDILTIKFTSGFAQIPADLKSAIYLKVGMLFDEDRNGFVNANMRETKTYNRIITSYMNFAG